MTRWRISRITTPCIHRPWTRITVSCPVMPKPAGQCSYASTVKPCDHSGFKMCDVAPIFHAPDTVCVTETVETGVEQRHAPLRVERHIVRGAVERIKHQPVRDYDHLVAGMPLGNLGETCDTTRVKLPRALTSGNYKIGIAAFKA